MLAALLVAGVLPATTGGADAGARAEGLSHVTLIGDSIATALPGDSNALQTLRQGSTWTCRWRRAGGSCT